LRAGTLCHAHTIGADAPAARPAHLGYKCQLARLRTAPVSLKGEVRMEAHSDHQRLQGTELSMSTRMLD